MSSAAAAARSWRTTFLILRDENLAVIRLLDQLMFSQSDSLIAAASLLPPHELASDLMMLLELARNLSHSPQDVTYTFMQLSQLIHGITRSSSLEMNSTLWTLVLDSFKRIVQIFFDNAKAEMAFVGNVAVV